jgi:hypothetical protein
MKKRNIKIYNEAVEEITQALDKGKGDIREAAKYCSLHQSSIYRYIKHDVKLKLIVYKHRLEKMKLTILYYKRMDKIADSDLIAEKRLNEFINI